MRALITLVLVMVFGSVVSLSLIDMNAGVITAHQATMNALCAALFCLPAFFLSRTI